MFNHLQRKKNLIELAQVENKLILLGNKFDKLLAHLINVSGLDLRIEEIQSDFFGKYKPQKSKQSIEDILEYLKSINCSEQVSIERIQKTKNVLSKLACVLKSELKIYVSGRTDKREFLLRMLKLINPKKDDEDFMIDNEIFINYKILKNHAERRNHKKIRQYSTI